jgi:hypothetical protein
LVIANGGAPAQLRQKPPQTCRAARSRAPALNSNDVELEASSQKPAAAFFKEREVDASQLNRLGVAYFLLGLLPISTTATKASLLSQTRRRPVVSGLFISVQVRTGWKNAAFIQLRF